MRTRQRRLRSSRLPVGLGTALALLLATAVMAVGLSSSLGAYVALPVVTTAIALLIVTMRPRGPAWLWLLVGSVAWTLEEVLWLVQRAIDVTLPTYFGGAVAVTDVPYMIGTVAWIVGLLRLPHVRRPAWTLSTVPPLVVLALLMTRIPDAGLALTFPFLDALLVLATLPALEGTLRGRANTGRLLMTLGFFVRGFSSANFAWLTTREVAGGVAAYHELWLLGYVLVALGIWLELRDDDRGVWPAATIVLGLETVIVVATSGLLATGPTAAGRDLTLLTLGYLQVVGVLAILVVDRRRRLKAESDLRRWSGLLRHLSTTSASATRIERPLETLFSEAKALLPRLHGLTAYGDPPVVIGHDDGYAFALVLDGAEIGHLHFSSQPDGSELLDSVTPLFTQQIERMHEHANWRDQAMSDELTGLHNRRGFELQLGRLLGRDRARPESLLIAMLDIDHFKRVNDLHGHPFGDSVLVLLGRLLRHHVRDEDIVVRWGGEEFLVVAAGLEEERARALFGRLRTALRESTPEPLVHPLSFSVGMTVGPIPDDPTVVFDRIGRADQALYTAKREGRDRVVVAPHKQDPR